MFFHCFTVSFYSTDIWWFSQEGVILKIDLLGKGLTQGIRGDKGSPLMGSCAVFISFIPEQSYKAMSNCLSLLVLPIQFLFSLLFYFQLNRQPLLFPCVAGNNNESNWHTRTPTHGPFSSPEPTVWPVPYACAQSYHPDSDSHGQLYCCWKKFFNEQHWNVVNIVFMVAKFSGKHVSKATIVSGNRTANPW